MRAGPVRRIRTRCVQVRSRWLSCRHRLQLLRGTCEGDIARHGPAGAGIDVVGEPEGGVGHALETGEAVDVDEIEATLAEDDVGAEELHAEGAGAGKRDVVQLPGDAERLSALLAEGPRRPAAQDAEELASDGVDLAIDPFGPVRAVVTLGEDRPVAGA